MKTTFIRALAVAMLATSMSAFAVTNDSKPADAASPCANTKQDDSAVNTSNSKKEKKTKKNQDKQKEQNNDQLLGIWG